MTFSKEDGEKQTIMAPHDVVSTPITSRLADPVPTPDQAAQPMILAD